MPRPAASRRRCMGAVSLVLALACPVTAWPWGGATHHYIAQHYSQHLPAYIDGLRAYDGTVDQKVTDADSRKSSTPGESPKHFIDIDAYPEFLQGTLTHNRAALEAQYGVSTVTANGVLPWAVGDVMATLTQQFQAQQWSAAAVTIADLCHYVGDAHQPLHCTQNYNGQLSGNSGIHSRYESTMMSTYLPYLGTAPMTVAYYPSSVEEMFSVIGSSWAAVSGLLAADNTAKAASGGSYNSTYYGSLWNNTQAMTRSRIDSATVVTASFVYTAWVNAGRPVVPGSTVTVDGGPVAAARFEIGPTPFRDELTVRFSGTGTFHAEVFDIRGARVAGLAAGTAGAGSATWRPAESGAGAGVYFVRVTGGGKEKIARVVYLR
ncbi:MAG: hypothetical protein HZB25_14310 [Candidatus Eisenbacteria bacterium]|nr:hypothetical protein [Candidatus Eisenbacteria bacterium]